MTRKAGKLVKWNSDKAYGFIENSKTKERVFVHKNNFVHRSRSIEPNVLVSYVISSDSSNRPCATQVLRSGETLPRKGKKSSKNVGLAIAVAIVFSLIVLMIEQTTAFPSVALWGYFLTNLSVFYFYWIDKIAAKKGHWRTPESTLHMLSLLGGWPSAWIAQHLFNHKFSKKRFQRIFWLTVIANIAILVFLSLGVGVQELASVFH